MMGHMGLGPDEESIYTTERSFLHGWLILAVLFAVMCGIIFMTTPAASHEGDTCDWPCFDGDSGTPSGAVRGASGASKAPARGLGAGFAISARTVASLVRQESGGHCCRRSRAGALGKYQIMPRTARIWSKAAGHPRLRRTSYRRLKRALYNPKISRDIARAYINHYKRKYGRDELVLIAYNGGPKRAKQAYRCMRKRGYLCVYRRETYNYVRSIYRMAGRKHMRIVCKCRYKKLRYKRRRRA